MVRDAFLDSKRGSLLILSSAGQDAGRHALVLAKCVCGDQRTYRKDNLLRTPRPACPKCTTRKKLGNSYATGKRLRRKNPYPVEIIWVNDPTPMGGRIEENELSRVYSNPDLCVHGFHLTEEEIAEGLRLARTHCPECQPVSRDPAKAYAAVKETWEIILKNSNLHETNPEWDISKTGKVTERTPQRASSGRGDTAGKKLVYKPNPEVMDAAQQRDDAIGGRRVKPEGAGPDSDESEDE